MFDAHSILSSVDKIIKNHSDFSSLLTPEDREFLVQKSVIRSANKGTILCEQNQVSNLLYVIIEGEVEVFQVMNGNKVDLGILTSGEVFGEVAALFLVPRIATIRVTRPTAFLEISAEVITELMDKRPQLREAIEQRYYQRTMETSLRSIPVFEKASENLMHILCSYTSLLDIENNEIVIHEGECTAGIFIIKKGTARAFVTIGGKQVNLALLHRWDHFGEHSLILGESSAVSIAALTNLQVLFIPRDGLLLESQNDSELKHIFESKIIVNKIQTDNSYHIPRSKSDVEKTLAELQKIITIS